MIAFSHRMGVRPTIEALHAHFLAVLPRIETHARIYFRYLKCLHKKEDAIAETVAVACYADVRIMGTLRKKSSQAWDCPAARRP